MIFQYNGYGYSRIYIEAKTLGEAQSKENRRIIFKAILKECLWVDEFADVRGKYKELFKDWDSDIYWEPWGKVSDKIFIDSHY